MGIFVPAKTPPEIVVKMHEELMKVEDEIGTYAVFAKKARLQAN